MRGEEPFSSYDYIQCTCNEVGVRGLHCSPRSVPAWRNKISSCSGYLYKFFHNPFLWVKSFLRLLFPRNPAVVLLEQA
jgi:hypothetical protein